MSLVSGSPSKSRRKYADNIYSSLESISSRIGSFRNADDIEVGIFCKDVL
jgi:hypothetical protein